MNESPGQPGFDPEFALVKARGIRAGAEISPSLDIIPWQSGENAAPPSRTRSFTPDVLWKYKWTIICVSLLALGISQTAVWTLIVPLYRATAKIEVQPIMQTPLDPDEEEKPLFNYGAYLQTQPDFMTNTDVLDRVLDQDDVRSTQWYRNTALSPIDKLRSPRPPLDRLRDQLEVDVPRGKQIVEVSMTSPVPGEAKVIVEAVANEYTKYVQGTRFKDDTEKLDRVKEESVRVRAEVQRLEAVVEELETDPALQAPEAQLEKLLGDRKTNIAALENTLRQYERTSRLIEARLSELEGASANTPADVSPPIDFAQDAQWQRLDARVRDLKSELARRKRNFGARHRDVIELEDELQVVEKELAERAAFLTTYVPDREGGAGASLGPVALSNDPAVLRRQLSELEHFRARTAEELDALQPAFTRDWGQFKKLKDSRAELAKRQYDLEILLKKMEQINQERKAPAYIRRIGDAIEPSIPSEDKRPKMALASLFGSIVAGIAVALLRFQLNPKVLDERDVTVHAGRVLGHLPLVPVRTAAQRAAVAFQTESIRTIRTALMPRFTGAAGQVLQITSAGPGTGKTTFAMKLAQSLAACGKRVLLVDADFRRASLSRRIGHAGAPGLSDLLSNPEMTQEQVAVAQPAGLEIIPAGQDQNSDVSELLANGVLARRIREWRSRFDAVLVDSSPIVPIADGSMLAQQVDGSIVLVREGHCDRRVVQEAMEQIAAVGGHSLGVVFVGTRAHQRYEAYEAEVPVEA